jgi:hypothetical protein
MTVITICPECGQLNGNHHSDCIIGKIEDQIDCFRQRSREYEE